MLSDDLNLTITSHMVTLRRRVVAFIVGLVLVISVSLYYR